MTKPAGARSQRSQVPAEGAPNLKAARTVSNAVLPSLLCLAAYFAPRTLANPALLRPLPAGTAVRAAAASFVLLFFSFSASTWRSLSLSLSRSRSLPLPPPSSSSSYANDEVNDQTFRLERSRVRR